MKSTKLGKNSIIKELSKYWDFNLNFVNETKEQITLEPIQKSLNNYWETIFQYKCGNYFFDLFIPELKLVIECDENNHLKYNKDYEKQRTDFIKNIQQYNLYRYNPDDSCFDVYVEIGKIFTFIYKNLS